MKLILREYNLKLKHTFRISRKSIDFQPSLIVELQSEGFSGFGEATSNPYYNITVPMMANHVITFSIPTALSPPPAATMIGSINTCTKNCANITATNR